MPKVAFDDFDNEIAVPYEAEQERLFQQNASLSIFDEYRLQLPKGAGRQHRGMFAEVVVSVHLEGYIVLFSESQEIKNGYILALLTSKWVEVQVGATRSYAIWAVTA